MNARYLIWSDSLGAWLGPDRACWTHFIRDAGRYQLNEAKAAALAEQSVLVLAPESLQQLLDTVGHALDVSHVSLCTCGVITGGYRDHREGCPMHGTAASRT